MRKLIGHPGKSLDTGILRAPTYGEMLLLGPHPKKGPINMPIMLKPGESISKVFGKPKKLTKKQIEKIESSRPANLIILILLLFLII